MTNDMEEMTMDIKDALNPARQRGVDYMIHEWWHIDNLTLAAAAGYCGCSAHAVNDDRESGHLYALILPERERGFRYPRWQFDVNSDRLIAVLRALSEHGVINCWVIHNFLTRPHAELGGITPAKLIADGSAALDPLLQLIRREWQD